MLGSVFLQSNDGEEGCTLQATEQSPELLQACSLASEVECRVWCQNMMFLLIRQGPKCGAVIHWVEASGEDRESTTGEW